MCHAIPRLSPFIFIRKKNIEGINFFDKFIKSFKKALSTHSKTKLFLPESNFEWNSMSRETF
jgi:hypothetical protein